MRAAAATFWRETESCLAACSAAWHLAGGGLPSDGLVPPRAPATGSSAASGEAPRPAQYFWLGGSQLSVWKADNYESNTTGDSVIFGRSNLLAKRIGPPIMSIF